MSVVAVKKFKDSIVIGSDSIIVYGYSQEKEKLAKLEVITKDIVIGSVGKAQGHFLLKQFCKTHTPRRTTDDSIMEFFFEFSLWCKDKLRDGSFVFDNSVIMIFKKKIFYIEHQYIKEIKKSIAIGAGMDFANAILKTDESQESVKKAIETACELSIFCEKPANIIKIDL